MRTLIDVLAGLANAVIYAESPICQQEGTNERSGG